MLLITILRPQIEKVIFMGFKKKLRDRKKIFIAERIEKDPTLEERVKISRAMSLISYFNDVHSTSDQKSHRVGSCVQDSKILAELLSSWGIESRVICADISVFNEMQKRSIIGRYVYHLAIDNPDYEKTGIVNQCITKLHKDGIDISFLDQDKDPYLADPMSVTIYHEQQIGGEGHDGHAIVETPNFYLDPTLGQTHREGLLDVPQMIVIPRSEAGPLKPIDQWITMDRRDWNVRLRKTKGNLGNLERVIEEKTMDLQGLLGENAVKHDQVIVQTIADDTFLAYAIRPDLEISKIYARWNHPDHLKNNEKVLKWLRKADKLTPKEDILRQIDEITRKKIIDKGGKVRPNQPEATNYE